MHIYFQILLNLLLSWFLTSGLQTSYSLFIASLNPDSGYEHRNGIQFLSNSPAPRLSYLLRFKNCSQLLMFISWPDNGVACSQLIITADKLCGPSVTPLLKGQPSEFSFLVSPFINYKKFAHSFLTSRFMSSFKILKTDIEYTDSSG